MPLKFVRQNIARIRADIIVYPADPMPSADGGTAFAVYEAAGREELLEARRKLGVITRGDVRYTEAFRLHASYLFHTPGPVYTDGNDEEEAVLRSCYRRSLDLASELSCGSIAFALLSSGTFGWPKKAAFQIAKDEILRHPSADDLQITLCLFDEETLSVAEELKEDILSYIDDHSVKMQMDVEYSPLPGNAAPKGRRTKFRLASILQAPLKEMDLETDKVESLSMPSSHLEDYLARAGESFHDRLLRLIDERGMTDPEVYKRANIDRKLFSKIRSRQDYRPKKDNVIALCMALELNLDETADLMRRAEYAFSPSRRKDLILQYCIENKLYDLMQVNEILYQFGESCI